MEIQNVHTTEEFLIKDDYFEDARFHGIDFSDLELRDYTFEDCVFERCSFREMALFGTSFRNCRFLNCQWILVKLNNTVLHDVEFKDSKLVGINFTDCNPFGFSPDFYDTVIDNCMFYHLNMKKRTMKNCKIFNTDFTETDFREADFSLSEFKETIIQACELGRADFRTARGYSIDPFTNKVKNAKFSFPGVCSFLGYLGIKIEE